MFAQPLLVRCSGFIALALMASACQEADTPLMSNQPTATPELAAEVPVVVSRPSEPSASPNSPIGLRYEVMGEPTIGAPLEIQITSQSQVVIRAMSFRVRGDTGLSVSGPTADLSVAEVAAGEPITRTVTVTPLVGGSHRLSVTVQGEINGVLQANNVTIRIQAGGVKQPLEPAGSVKTDEAGEAVISLPLQESR